MANVAFAVWSCPEAKAGPTLVRFLGPWSGIITHWNGKRPLACPGEDECRLHDQYPKWKGYAPGEVWSKTKRLWTPWIIELTVGFAECTGSIDLRGSCWLVSREKRVYGERAVVAVEQDRYDADRLQRPFAVEKGVCKIYDTTRILWGVDVGPFLRETAETSEDAPPAIPGYNVPAGSQESERRVIDPGDTFRRRGAIKPPVEHQAGNGKP